MGMTTSGGIHKYALFGTFLYNNINVSLSNYIYLYTIKDQSSSFDSLGEFYLVPYILGEWDIGTPTLAYNSWVIPTLEDHVRLVVPHRIAAQLIVINPTITHTERLVAFFQYLHDVKEDIHDLEVYT